MSMNYKGFERDELFMKCNRSKLYKAYYESFTIVVKQYDKKEMKGISREMNEYLNTLKELKKEEE